ncbi:hypothetical protein C8F04DRAFT_1058758 [Mycena alexandri]|uniref:F-box domain-containing protein n=1 Tax=Mycena alexandri TaxID=1745969 RepID=A0AAD6TJB3_9AGAR|nr:hypothetical protein C8F04DRAFT_1058758 [Mycena alexandri]
MSLQAVPPEIIESICHCLDALTIMKLAQVSRQFRRIVQSSALQYKTQLELAGLRDGQVGNFGSAARLDMLKAYQAAWAGFDWSQSTQTTVPIHGLWELVGNVFATYSSETGFVFNRIPSPLRHIPDEQWSITAVSCDVNDFSMDLSLDLLLVVELNSSKSVVIHLLSLKTGRPHPLARQPRLSAELNSPSPSATYFYQIRIFGEYIGVMTEHEDEILELHVWEWKTGTLKKHIFEEHITSFAFLDHQRLLVSGFADLHPELRVLEINDSPTDTTSFTFVLPELSLDPSDMEINIQTEPPPSWPANARLAEPFTTSHTDRLFVVSLGGWDSHELAFMLCIQLSTILNLMDKPMNSAGHHTISWEQWGPSTRMLRVPKLPEGWVCYVYGQRCVIQTDKTQWKILDFNQFDLDPQSRIKHEKTVDRRCRMFAQPVSTSAPFTLRSISIPHSIHAAMLAEDAIVAVLKDENLVTIFSI